MENYDPSLRRESWSEEKDNDYDSERKENDDETEGLLMERGIHYCNKEEKFQDNFKMLYERTDPRLFKNENLHFDVASEVK